MSKKSVVWGSDFWSVKGRQARHILYSRLKNGMMIGTKLNHIIPYPYFQSLSPPQLVKMPLPKLLWRTSVLFPERLEECDLVGEP